MIRPRPGESIWNPSSGGAGGLLLSNPARGHTATHSSTGDQLLGKPAADASGLTRSGHDRQPGAVAASAVDARVPLFEVVGRQNSGRAQAARS